MPDGIESPMSTNTFGLNLNAVDKNKSRSNSPYSQLPNFQGPESPVDSDFELKNKV